MDRTLGGNRIARDLKGVRTRVTCKLSATSPRLEDNGQAMSAQTMAGAAKIKKKTPKFIINSQNLVLA